MFYRCFQMFSDVFRCSQDALIRCVRMFNNVLSVRSCSWMFSRCFHDIWSKSFFKWKFCLWWFKRIWWSLADGLKVISNESTDFNDPEDFDDSQLFDDPQLFVDPQQFDDQLEVWTLIIEKSTVIPPLLMVLFSWSGSIRIVIMLAVFSEYAASYCC